MLKAADGLCDAELAEAVATSLPTIKRTRKRFATARLKVPTERPRLGKPPVLDPPGEARLIAEVCSQAPAGRQRWTLQLLVDCVVALGSAEACSADTVRRVLKKWHKETMGTQPLSRNRKLCPGDSAQCSELCMLTASFASP